jgi:CO/xanthine dehydrogenase FAD-binding subunit
MDLIDVETYFAPHDRPDLARFAPGDTWLGGGTGLFAGPGERIVRLHDLHALRWPPLTWTPDGLRIAATCTLSELAALDIPPEAPALHIAAECCHALRGSFKILNAATVGGNICGALAAGPMTSLAVALDAIGVIWTAAGEERRAPIIDVVTGNGQTSLGPTELLRSVDIPQRTLRARTAMRRASLLDNGRSATLIIGRLDGDGMLVLTVTAATPKPVRIAFPGIPTEPELALAIEECVSSVGWLEDVHGSPAWRRHLTLQLAEQIRRDFQTEQPS